MADRDVEGLLRWSLACMSLASAVIHASAAADHEGLALHTSFFLVVAAVQSGLAAALLRRSSGRWVVASVAFNGAVAAIWVVSRTVGLPVEGAAVAEPIGFKDGISTLLEFGICAGAGFLLTLPEAARRIAVAAGPIASTVIAASVWGLGVSGLLARHAHEHVHLHGGEVAVVADHHHDGDHEARLPSADLPDGHHHDHEGFSRPAVVHAAGRHGASVEAVDDAGAAEHDHGVHHRHDAAPAGEDDPGVHGPEHQHDHEHAPPDEPGAGQHDPDDDGPAAGRLIDDVMRLLDPHSPRSRRYQP